MFSQKKIRVEVQKISGILTPFSGTYNFYDLPIEVKISKASMPAGYMANINIYGISKSKMDSMTTMAWKTGFIDQISARVFVNDGNGEHTLFEGTVMSAIPNYSSAPDICISITACAGAWYNLKTDVPPSSIQGDQVPVPDIFAKICSQYGVLLDNRGVIGMAKNPRIDGDGLAVRIAKAAKAYNVNYYIDNTTVTIYPKDTFLYRANAPTLLTSKDYIGYPSFNNNGILELKLDRLLHPIQLGDFFIIKGSEVTAANDKWQVIKVIYDLSTKIGGKWQTSINGIRVGIIS